MTPKPIMDGAARAFWLCAYADWASEHKDRTDISRPKPGEDWADYAPETPGVAYFYAGQLMVMLRDKNEVPIEILWRRACEADGYDSDPEDFGHCLAMQAMGHGVSWFDDHEPFEIEIPYLDVSWYHFDEDLE